MKKRVLLITCEHAGNQVPPTYKPLFSGGQEVLETHRGWDSGAVDVAQALAKAFDLPCYYYENTRLLIELNRSLDHPQLFSEYSMVLNDLEKQYLIDTFYLPYRNQMSTKVAEEVAQGRQVVHLSIHSFTPIWDGVERKVEIGLLFDEDRKFEGSFCSEMKEQLLKTIDCNVCFNEPYLGKDDGFTTYLRTQYTDENYLGLEIEISQKYNNSEQMLITQALVHTLKELI